MRILLDLLSISSIAFLAIIAARGLLTKSLKSFPFFYAHAIFGFMVGLAMYAVYRLYYYSSPSVYARIYWVAQFSTMAATASGVFVETIRHSFIAGRARKFGRASCAFFFCVLAVCGFLWFSKPTLYGAFLNAALERDFRAFQAFFIIVLISGFRYFNISISKRIMSMLLGLGFYVGFSLLFLALAWYGKPKGIGDLVFLQPSFYVICLTIWLVGLWSVPPQSASNFPQNGNPKAQFAWYTKQPVSD